ncbi:MAG TPA: hypothetical protein VHT73_06565 [Thermodesulfobacteriota bacterium]|nr:hypothetical protein [Thermodesulfobacteriota bacterium]
MDNWRIIESAFDPQKQSHKETVFTIGNGYLGVRGTFEEGVSERKATTLIHGVFDDSLVYSTELVNVPNWLDFNIFVNGEWLRMGRGKVLSYQRELDLRTGVLTRKVRWQSPKEETLDLEIERFASMADEHVLGIRCRATAVNFSGTLEFRAGIPGHVNNSGWVHLEWNDQGRIDAQSAYLEVQTRATKIKLCEAIRLALDGVEAGSYEYWDTTLSPTLTTRINVIPGEQVTAEKLVAVFTSRDTPDPKAAAQGKLAEAAGQGYGVLRQANDAAWAKEWERCNILIEGDDEADRALRYSLFQLLIAAPRHDDRVSIPAKSLSGYGYRGHVFWDTEVFILPFLIYTRPEIARNLLIYRYHTLTGDRVVSQYS